MKESVLTWCCDCQAELHDCHPCPAIRHQFLQVPSFSIPKCLLAECLRQCTQRGVRTASYTTVLASANVMSLSTALVTSLHPWPRSTTMLPLATLASLLRRWLLWAEKFSCVAHCIENWFECLDCNFVGSALPRPGLDRLSHHLMLNPHL